jgi:hypothetical protein
LRSQSLPSPSFTRISVYSHKSSNSRAPGTAEYRVRGHWIQFVFRAKRRGFKPLTDREIKQAIEEGRP